MLLVEMVQKALGLWAGQAVAGARFVEARRLVRGRSVSRVGILS